MKVSRWVDPDINSIDTNTFNAIGLVFFSVLYSLISFSENEKYTSNTHYEKCLVITVKAFLFIYHIFNRSCPKTHIYIPDHQKHQVLKYMQR